MLYENRRSMTNRYEIESACVIFVNVDIRLVIWGFDSSDYSFYNKSSELWVTKRSKKWNNKSLPTWQRRTTTKYWGYPSRPPRLRSRRHIVLSRWDSTLTRTRSKVCDMVVQERRKCSSMSRTRIRSWLTPKKSNIMIGSVPTHSRPALKTARGMLRRTTSFNNTTTSFVCFSGRGPFTSIIEQEAHSSERNTLSTQLHLHFWQ